MILTQGPDDVCLGDWIVLTEDSVLRFPTLRKLERHMIGLAKRGQLPPHEPLRSLYVHWSLLNDVERQRVFAAV
jgi:hypothetical protein